MSNLLDQFGDVLLKKSNDAADLNVKVFADDFESEGGRRFEWEDYFFEPKVGEKYQIKLLISPGEEEIVHKQVFTNLPDPKGGVFRYSLPAGFQSDDPLFNAIVELYRAKKGGDIVAEKKLEKFGRKKQQGCVKIQILQSPNKDDIGKIKLFAYQSYGPNAKIAELIKTKTSPSKEQEDAGVEKENIFSIFETSIMHIICKKGTFEGKEGRDMSESLWSTKKQGSYVVLDDGRDHRFSEADIVDGKIKEDVKPFFEKLVEKLTENHIYEYFGPKMSGDPRNSEEDEKYLVEVKAKADKAAEMLESMTFDELSVLAAKKSSRSNAAEGGDIYESSIPDEIKDTVQASAVKTETVDDSDEIAKLL